MLKLIILGAVIYGLLSYGLDEFEEQAYQAKAVRCATQPEMLGCDQFQTAAGPDNLEQP